MAENKKSFVLYADLLRSIEHLTNEEKGILFNHLLEYVNDKNPVLEDRLLLTAWKPIETQLKRDLIKFEETKENRSINGRLGNLKRWNFDLYTKVVENELNINEAEAIVNSRKLSQPDSELSQTVANIADNVNDSVNVNVNDNVKENNIDPINWGVLLSFFNKQFNKNCTVVSEKVKSKFKARLKEGYTKKHIFNAIINISKDEYHIETKYKYATLEFISRSDKLDAFGQDEPIKDLGTTNQKIMKYDNN